ncbi:MAG: cysteine protease [Planctomycetes bacterium]|nr:cysteine protease [Planctomycetota bacterium]
MYEVYRNPVISSLGQTRGTGWLPPVPDLRDYGVADAHVEKKMKAFGLSPRKAGDPALPSKVDLREWCSPIEDQGQLGSCTANAAVAIIEYFQRRAYKKHIDGSRLFIYKCTRSLMGTTGDSGAWLRDTMSAIALCGVAPESRWPYTDQAPDFDREIPAFLYAIADNYEALEYIRHDPSQANLSGEDVLQSIKKYIAGGIPSMFGFWGFDSFDNSSVRGGIPFPGSEERAKWGHAIAAVGYDDDLRIKNTRYNIETVGALLIRNSWGTGWGDRGYGWMPYEYVRSELALDFWSLISMEWLDTDQFGL